MPQRREADVPLHLKRPRALWTSSEPGRRVEAYDFFGIGRARNGCRDLPTPAKVLPFCKGL